MLLKNFLSDANWGLLLVDAKNAFNSLNRVAALWNARVLWPCCSRFLFNTYHGYAALFLQGSSDYLLSREGVTQGDPLSMMLYAVAILPLICSLKNPKRWIQNWYADDSPCVATLPSLHAWFSQLLSSGPAFGYLPQLAKTILVVVPSYVNQATSLFSDLGIKVGSGFRFLGGFVGECSMASDFVTQKVKMWVDCVQHLSDVAKVQPCCCFQISAI